MKLGITSLTIYFLCSSAIAKLETIEFVGSLGTANQFAARYEKWQLQAISERKTYLREIPSQPDVVLTSKTECGTRVCTSYLFEPTGKNYYRFIGRVNGIFEPIASTSNGRFDLKAKSAIGALGKESMEEIYRFNGKQYLPLAGTLKQ